MEQEKPSKVLRDFLNFLKYCQKTYQENILEVSRHDKCVQDFLHEFEFAQNEEEWNEVAIRVSNSRKERRKSKDIAQSLEKCAKFYSDKSNKQFFDKLKNLFAEQEKIEQYLESERIYKPRAGDKK